MTPMAPRSARVLLLLLALAACVLPARARVGETRAEFERRFGAGKQVGDQVLFVVGAKAGAGGYNATVFFDPKTHRATMTVYAAREDNQGNIPDLGPEQIDFLLNEESGGRTWYKFNGTAQPTWQRADRQLFARLRPIFVRADEDIQGAKTDEEGRRLDPVVPEGEKGDTPHRKESVLVFMSPDYAPMGPDIAVPGKGR